MQPSPIHSITMPDCDPFEFLAVPRINRRASAMTLPTYEEPHKRPALLASTFDELRERHFEVRKCSIDLPLSATEVARLQLFLERAMLPRWPRCHLRSQDRLYLTFSHCPFCAEQHTLFERVHE